MLTTMRVPRSVRRLVLDAADIPADLDDVTTIAWKEEADPAAAGMTRAGVDAIWDAAERLYATGMHPGLSLVLRRHGHVVLKRAIGHAQGNGPGDHVKRPVPMTPDTPVCIYSASKAMAAMTVHLLSERKALSLLDPVSHYVPEFGRNGKRDITIYQLLCHKAGIPTIPTDGLDVADLLLDQRRSCGSSTRRHPKSRATTTRITRSRRVSSSPTSSRRSPGRASARFFREHISGPLGLRSIDFGARGAALKRVARNYATGFRFDAPGRPVPEARHRHEPRPRDRIVERRALLSRGHSGGQRGRDGRRRLQVLPVPARRRPAGARARVPAADGATRDRGGRQAGDRSVAAAAAALLGGHDARARAPGACTGRRRPRRTGTSASPTTCCGPIRSARSRWRCSPRARSCSARTCRRCWRCSRPSRSIARRCRRTSRMRCSPRAGCSEPDASARSALLAPRLDHLARFGDEALRALAIFDAARAAADRSTPRWQAGRAASCAFQRDRCGNGSISTPDHLCVRTQAQFAMSAIE